MDKLLEFIDRLCLDERLYWRVPYLGKPGNAEVTWRRDARPAAWSIRDQGQEEFKHYVKSDMKLAVETHALDPIAFERMVGASILTQAVFADMVMEGAVELFGHEVVRQSISDTRSFLAGVSDAAQRMTKATTGMAMPPKTPKKPAPKAAPKLRLVSIAWFCLAAAFAAKSQESRAEASGSTSGGALAGGMVDVDDVADASLAQLLLPTASSYLPFVGAGLAVHAERAASHSLPASDTETFHFALAFGLVKNL